MRENHLLSPGPLLDAEGNLSEAGYAKSLVKDYDRKSIVPSPLRVKEWDYYYVGTTSYGLALTVADNGYMSLLSVSILDFASKKDISKTKMGLFPKGKLHLPHSSKEGDVHVSGKGYDFLFQNQGNGKRRLIVRMANLEKGRNFNCDLLLEETAEDTLVIATPFKKKGHFYYNQKINCMRAHGYAKLGEKTFDFNSLSYGVLDWGRGVWPYKNTWYWSSMSAQSKGHLLGWNLGYGFGDTKAASENMLYLDGRGYKIGDVRFAIPYEKGGKTNFLNPWRINDDEGMVNVTFLPVYDRHSDTNLLFLRSNQHQVFGFFSGKLRFGNTEITIENLPGFAEKVFNKW